MSQNGGIVWIFPLQIIVCAIHVSSNIWTNYEINQPYEFLFVHTFS